MGQRVSKSDKVSATLKVMKEYLSDDDFKTAEVVSKYNKMPEMDTVRQLMLVALSSASVIDSIDVFLKSDVSNIEKGIKDITNKKKMLERVVFFMTKENDNE